MATETKVKTYLPELAKVVSVKQMTAKERLFTFQFEDAAAKKAFTHEPGQFVEVTVFGYGEAPISITSAPLEEKGTFELCIRSAGVVTGKIHAFNAGAEVGVRGPYGKGFPYKEMKGKDVLLVAGGLGLAPLRSLINNIYASRREFKKVVVLYGTKNPSEILFDYEFPRWKEALDFRMTVDRGDDKWKGNVGVVTTLFKGLEIEPKGTLVAVCGPPVMYKFVAKELEALKIPDKNIYMSLERRMECGLGKCCHCGIGSKLVCMDGPVFTLEEIRQIKEAI
jgi:NAD(P)H-flavin reductase